MHSRLISLMSSPIRAMGLAALLTSMGVAPALADADADLLADFRHAATQKGCQSIPYEDARRNCVANSEEVEKNCKQDVVKCDTLLGQKQRLLDKLKNARIQMDRVITKRSGVEEKLKKTKVEGEKTKYTREISTLNREIASHLEDVEALRREAAEFDTQFRVNVGLQNAKLCLTSRSVVDQIFNLQSDRIMDEKLGSKASDAQKKELKALASAIIEKMKPEWRVHEIAIKDTHGRIANCQKVVDMKPQPDIH
jgi:hypothetical protein